MIIVIKDYTVTYVSLHVLVSLSGLSYQKIDEPSQIEMLLRRVKHTLTWERGGQ